MPCTWCFRKGLKCRMSEKSARCGECVKRGRQCDGVLVSSSLERLSKTEKKLEDDEEAAEEALAKLQEDLSHAVNRLRRIRQIKKKVKERSDEAFRRGIQELDEEDSLLPALNAHEYYVESDLAFMGVTSDADWPSLGLGELPEESGVGETASAAAGSSSS
ncbi:uncharacterized protein VDAG_06271 [Verticillium dahliae VdLs.17]|uniref:Zn(2)-C6 fungal-type domain-containing protein n=3 Tax=Verticillium dahliae TaxID=27337 RepID=G2XAQ1_VERDV|nr:uncharacterized protein VDAG_05958 [Verticillium dahliae VdLs.17]XP_009654531.1 uncharacterized protein VDAG_07331 [Verticillium dahliae VdLs.17]XP_009655926.1 uncharacterized protein VDAG_08254 [Verticillium dahliae VdLs.17]XP_009657580.1 uncharacterized protein VDAG_06271 [Verticillium dahliae VdLs.17]EGY14794.1 hypothetical protein VDAG_05958 [Verticillium dahliae VdLs.17]EGY15417.1 hypothetical protein VDAG_06271 [Verticillium dahliae VdLs.17]EGY16167.1 hypothetical protein VDAG_07331 